jgi:hypothetical protein
MTRYFFIYFLWKLRFCQLWGALSDERTGLSFSYASLGCQVKVKVTLKLTVSQSVCLDVEPRSVVCGSQWVMAVHSVLRASQRELIWCLPFPFSFLYNPIFRISRWFLAFLIRHEDGSSMFFRKVDWLPSDYKVLYILFTCLISICIFPPFLQFILFYKCS